MFAGSWRSVSLQGKQQNQREDIWKKVFQREKKSPFFSARGQDWFLKLKLEARRGKNVTTYFKNQKMHSSVKLWLSWKVFLIPVPPALSLQTRTPSANSAPQGCGRKNSWALSVDANPCNLYRGARERERLLQALLTDRKQCGESRAGTHSLLFPGHPLETPVR